MPKLDESLALQKEILWLVCYGHLKRRIPPLLPLLQTNARANATLVWYILGGGMVICTLTHEEINSDTSLYCCQTVCVVYIITCQGCRRQYVGRATNTLDVCHWSHRSEMVELKSLLGIHLLHCKKGKRGFTLHILEKEEGMAICIVTQEEINLDIGLYCCQIVCVVYIITCQGCRHQYVGKATITLDVRHTPTIGLKWLSWSCCWASTFSLLKRAKEASHFTYLRRRRAWLSASWHRKNSDWILAYTAARPFVLSISSPARVAGTNTLSKQLIL